MPLSMAGDELALWMLLLRRTEAARKRGETSRSSAIIQPAAARELEWLVGSPIAWFTGSEPRPDTRRVQTALRSLRIVYGKLIGSWCKPPYGMSICTTDEDVQEWRGQLVSRVQEAVDLLHACDVDALRRFQREHPDIDLNPSPTPEPPRRRCRFCQQAWAKPGSDYCGGSCEWMHKLPFGNQRKTA